MQAQDVLIAISKTGFPLEHDVSEAFRRKGWSIVGNRYYVDDVDGRARELDLIAYRANKVAGIEVVTSVLISCKKDAENTWAMLSRERNKNDPNINWCPIHQWTNVEPLRTYLESEEWEEGCKQILTKGHPAIFVVERDIFAFQIVSPPGVPQKTNPAKGSAGPVKQPAPQNDTPIFSSISGLLKALDFEKGALRERMANRRRLYFFALAIVADVPLVDVQFGGSAPTVIDVKRRTHLAQYMVRKSHLSSLLQIVSKDELEAFVGQMDSLADTNAKVGANLLAASLAAIETSASVQGYFAKRLKPFLSLAINKFLRELASKERIGELGIGSRFDGGIQFELDLEEPLLKKLNDSEEIREEASRLLREIAGYKGPFEFVFNIPF
jgi:hypothetical protein